MLALLGCQIEMTLGVNLCSDHRPPSSRPVFTRGAMKYGTIKTMSRRLSCWSRRQAAKGACFEVASSAKRLLLGY